MSVYNGQAFLSEAIDSILGQTFADFEFLIIDDGSTDDSAKIVAGYDDPRLRLIRNECNLQEALSLNRGLARVRGRYVARMDADDVSLPTRLQQQVDFLEANPQVGACGSWLVTMGDRAGRVWKYPTGAEEIRCRLVFDTAMAHPTVCLRREMFARHGLQYADGYAHAEDYSLWRRASENFPLANLGQVLLRYRIHDGSVSVRYRQAQVGALRKIHGEVLGSLRLAPSERELDLHRWVARGTPGGDIPPLEDIDRWLQKLLCANRAHRAFPDRAFEAEVGRRWLHAANRAVAHGQPAVARFLASPLARHVILGRKARLVARAAKRAFSPGTTAREDPRGSPPARETTPGSASQCGPMDRSGT